MFGVQARIFDSAFFEVSGGGLKDVEHRHMPRAPSAVILSRTDGEGPLRRRNRERAMRGSSPSVRLGMTTNRGARRVCITRSARSFFVLLLTPSVLAAYECRRRDMQNLHCRIGRGYALTAWSAGATNFNAKLFRF